MAGVRSKEVRGLVVRDKGWWGQGSRSWGPRVVGGHGGPRLKE